MKVTGFLVLWIFAGFLWAQDQPADSQGSVAPKSVADVARESKQATLKTSTKRKVLTNEDLSRSGGPIPDIAFDGQDNADLIIKAITAFQRSHTPEETEAAVRSWFETHDAMLERAIRENKRISERQQAANYGSYYEDEDSPPNDARQYFQLARIRSENALRDRETAQRNGLQIARIQNDFTKVRNALIPMGLKYEWLKIRCGNGNCSF